MQFQFVLFKTKNYIFYQQLQSAAIMYLLVPSASQESPILLANVQVPSREEIFLKKFDWRGNGLTGYEPEPCLPKPSSDFRWSIILKKWFIGCGRTSTADPAPGRSFSSRGYRVAVGQCGSLVLPSPGGGGVGQKLKVDIVGRWGRVAPMKKKIIRSQERWGRVSWFGPALSSHSQFVLDLSFPRSASKRSRATSRVGITNCIQSGPSGLWNIASVEVVSERIRSLIVTRGST